MQVNLQNNAFLNNTQNLFFIVHFHQFKHLIILNSLLKQI